MRSDLTDITLVVDRSGSMQSIRNDAGQRLATMVEQDRPGLVVLVVMTDGEENSSKEFSKADIKTMIQLQQDKYGWHFTFLGADQDAFAEAREMGMAASSAASFFKDKVAAAYRTTGAKVSRMRKQTLDCLPVANDFTVQEREGLQ